MDLIENRLESKIIKRHPWELARYFIIENQIKSLLKNKEPLKIILLDIGCGDAFVINSLAEKFSFKNSIGIDINFTDDIISKLKQNNPNVKYLKNIESLEINPNEFYIILLNDVIEHVEDHQHFLETLNRIIFQKVEKLVFFITVPAFQKLFSKHDLDLGHFRRYKIQNLKNYNEILKLEIKGNGYFFFTLFIARFFEKLFNIKNDKIGVSEWNENKILTIFLLNILKIDYKIGQFSKYLGLNLPGLSAYIIFKK